MWQLHMKAIFLLVACCVVLCLASRVNSTFVAARQISDLVGRRVHVSQKPQTVSPETVFFLVDGSGKLTKKAVLPYEGRPVAAVVSMLQNMFGRPNVVMDTRDSSHDGKVVVVHDGNKRKVVKVNIPRRWSVQPDYVDVPVGTRVSLNSSLSEGLVLKTDATSTVLLATLYP